MNPPQIKTLEEDVIAKESPVGVSQIPVGLETGFHPANAKTVLSMSVA